MCSPCPRTPVNHVSGLYRRRACPRCVVKTQSDDNGLFSTNQGNIHQAGPLQAYRGNSRGLGVEGGFSSPLFSPVCDRTSLIAPRLESIAEVSTGMKITFELLVRVISRRLSM